MADRRYLYAYVVLAVRRATTEARGGALVARSDDEARGLASRLALEAYPDKDGWEDRRSTADRISEADLRAAGWTWIPGPPTESG